MRKDSRMQFFVMTNSVILKVN